MTEVILVTLLVCLTGLIIGLLLGGASELFKVSVDEKESRIREELPGNNCGGCGYAGCDALAEAIAKGAAKVNACPVGGAPVAEKIAGILGVDAGSMERQVAFVRCAGTCDKTKQKYEYYGDRDCREASVVPGGGDKACAYGCLGFGSCVKACEFGALSLHHGIAQVEEKKCKACGKCVETCPRGLITLVPADASVRVQCFSKAQGKAVKAVCEAGCIGCGLCEKNCEAGAITLENHLASIQYNLCTGCGTCMEKCPVKVIHLYELLG